MMQTADDNQNVVADDIIEVPLEDALPSSDDYEENNNQEGPKVRTRLSKGFKKSFKTLKNKTIGKKGKSKPSEKEDANPQEEETAMACSGANSLVSSDNEEENEEGSSDVKSESDNKVEDSEVQDLRAEIAQLQAQVAQLQGNNDTLQGQNETLQNQVKELTTENEAYKADPENYKTKVDTQAERITELEDNVANWKALYLEHQEMGPSKVQGMEDQIQEASNLAEESKSSAQYDESWKRVEILEAQLRESVRVLKGAQKKMLERHEREFSLRTTVDDLNFQISDLNSVIAHYKKSVNFFQIQLEEEEKQSLEIQQNLDLEKDRLRAFQRQIEDERRMKAEEEQLNRTMCGDIMPCFGSEAYSSHQQQAEVQTELHAQ